MVASDRDILPDSVKPIHYSISLSDIDFVGNFSYKGIVAIDLKVLRPTQEIVLNALQLDLRQVDIKSANGQNQTSSGVSLDEKAQRATIRFKQEIPPSDAVLRIEYHGTVNNIMAGFYRSKYKSAVPAPSTMPMEGQHCLMFSTQFESCDARRALPCFDEPNIKATFDLEIEIPAGLTALSNMPEKSSRPGKDGHTFVVFERTPIMSTYLLAWAFGDFEYVEDFTQRKYGGKQLPVRVYTTRGLREQGRWALEHAHKTVDYFSEIFQIDYPLPKVDMLAVHEFSQGAMENWGLITYRTTAILFDEHSSDAKYRKRIAYVVAHELAHQWFGNLVTMDWWNELWLNESFATWVGYLATNHFHPEWDEWAQFTFDAKSAAFNIDGLRSSHPIEVPVRNAIEVEQIFDAISYYKGSSVIRMLSNFLGVQPFLNGVADYLKGNTYGNATTGDLWTALSKASGKDVKAFMDPWVTKVGFPVLTVAEEPGQISVRQSRFLLGGGVEPEDDQTVWWVPLNMKSSPQATKVDTSALSQKGDTIRDIDEKFYKLNTDATGFYRTNYPPDRLTKLGAAREQLSAPDRIGLVADAAALASSGDATTAGFLSLIAGFKHERNFLVWSQILSSLGTIRSIFSSSERVSGGLKNFVSQLISPAVEAIGWDFKPDEDYLTGQLRALLLTVAGNVEHTPTVVEAQRRFAAFRSGDTAAIHPNLRLPIYRIAVQMGGREAYDFVTKSYLEAPSGETRELCLTALGRVQEAELARDFMDFQFSDAVALQDTHTGSAWLAMNAKARPAVWAWMQSNWDKVTGKLSGNAVAMDRYVRVTMKHFATQKELQDMEAFFQGKDTTAFARSLVQIVDTVKSNVAYLKRDEALMLEYLQAHDYVQDV